MVSMKSMALEKEKTHNHTMRKIQLIVHMSLDNFIASEDGSFDLFDQSPENLDFVNSVTDGADAALFGRVSYELINQFWPTAKDQPDASQSQIKYSNWYNNADKIVISNTLTANTPNTRIIGQDLSSEITAIKHAPGKNILMFGSPTAFKALNEVNVIDEYWIIQYPAIFGKGLTLFYPQSFSKLRLLQTRKLSKGEMALNYEVKSEK
jgi:dihydrofolate reductase